MNRTCFGVIGPGCLNQVPTVAMPARSKIMWLLIHGHICIYHLQIHIPYTAYTYTYTCISTFIHHIQGVYVCAHVWHCCWTHAGGSLSLVQCRPGSFSGVALRAKVAISVINPKGPCTQIVYTLPLKYSPYRYFWAKVSTIWVHGPLG